jgi:DNA-binding MarR family transcriptional regulator
MMVKNRSYLDEQVFLLLSQNYALCKKMADRTVARQGITVAEYSMLRLLAREPGATASAIRKHLFASAPFVAQTVKALERKGLLHREKDTRDVRRQFLHLTARGRDVASRTRDEIQQALSGLALPQRNLRALHSELTALFSSFSSYGEHVLA